MGHVFLGTQDPLSRVAKKLLTVSQLKLQDPETPVLRSIASYHSPGIIYRLRSRGEVATMKLFPAAMRARASPRAASEHRGCSRAQLALPKNLYSQLRRNNCIARKVNVRTRARVQCSSMRRHFAPPGRTRVHLF